MSFLQRSNNVDIIDGLDLAVDRDYDKNAMLRIMELYKLRDIMMQYLEEQEVITPPPKNNKCYKQNSIYSCVLHSVDSLLYNFVNDESLVVLNGREPLRLTMGVCIRGLVENNYKFPRQDNAVREIQDLYSNRNDEVIGSMILDFSVSIFSVLENFFSDLYYLKEKKEKVAKDEKRYRGNIPAREKIISVLNLCMSAADPIDKKDKLKFSECVDVLREIRNTIHTLGVYTKNKEITYTVGGATVYLRKSRSVTADDHRFHFLMCKEVVDIYRMACVVLNVGQLKYIEFDV